MDQLDAIRKVTMARIVCDNTDLGETQPNIFMTEDNAGNRMTSCSDTNTIPELDMAPFKESQPSPEGLQTPPAGQRCSGRNFGVRRAGSMTETGAVR